MRRKWKKLLSTTLALAMVITTIGVREVPVSAAEEENTNESVVYMDNMAYDTTTGHFYKLSSVGTYEQVNAEAKESGGYLACISSAEENEIVAKVSSTGTTTASSYIGLTRNAENLQEWLWADGSEVNYTNWNEGEPNSESEIVAEIYNSTRSSGAEKWNDCTVSSGKTGVIEYNECIHPESQYVVKNKTFADCEQGGYTGDTYCGFCNEKIADGKETEPGGHAEAVIDEKTVKEATCTEEGYTGDKICPTCKKVLEQGQTTPANRHTESEELRKVREASCYLDGYTGETYCTVCGETIEAGDAITKLEHEYEDNVCKNCGRINNAQLDTTYTSKTTNLYPFQVIQFKAPENGTYKFYCENITNWDSYGYLFKEENFNDQVIKGGIEKFNAKLENSNVENSRLDGFWGVNDDGGKNGAPAITEELEKDKTYYFVLGTYYAYTYTGEFSVTITCTHDKTHIEGKTLSDCTVGGYTGDTVCDICGKVVEQGQTLEPGEHQEAVLDVKDATCYVTGYTGDTYCSFCNIKLAEGTVIPKLEHEYEDNVCKNCGRINNAQLDTTYTSKTTNLYPFQVIQFKAPENGKYKFHCENITVWDSYGYLFKEENFNDQVIIDGIEKFNAKIENNTGGNSRLKGYWKINDDDGANSAPEITAELEKDKIYYFVVGPYSTATGEFSITITCTHEKTHREGRTLSDCTEGGYTGDVICDTCGKLVEQGQTLEPGEHTVEVVDAREANCYIEGKTGEEKCSVCDKVLKENKAIPKLEHKYENDICKNCGRINNAQLDTTYTSKTTNLYPFQVIQFKAPENGKYKFHCENITVWDSYGYLFKEENFNDQVIIDGIEKFNAKIENNTGGNSRLKGYWKINDDDGANSAPEITAELEKDKIYYFVVGPYSTATGEFSITITCTHEKTHREGRTLSDCTEGGYTGDVICDTCGKLVEQGQTLEPGEHTVEVVDAREANCYIEGKTGEEKCSVCDKVLKENKVIPKLEHKYENNICKNCGRIENAKKGTEYSSYITEKLPIQVVEYTAPKTEKIIFECNNTRYWNSIGYLFDETNYSDEMLMDELEKYYSGDSDYISFKNYLAENEYGGGTGAPAIKYKVQKDKKYYLVIVPQENDYGEFTVTIDCPHDRTHVENKAIKTCSEGGYTGDVICDLCGKVVKHGENIEPDSEHNYINYKSIEPTCNEYGKRYLKCVNCGNEKVLEDEDDGYADHRYVLVNSVKATCTTDGYLGDSKCKYCGLENENQPENKVIKAYHDMDPEEIDSCLIKDYKGVEATCEKEGYTGDVYCTICHKVIKEGKTIEKLEHSFKDGKCMECGADEKVVKSEKDGYYEISTFDQLITYLKNVESGISGKLIEFPENYDDEDDVIGRKTLKNSTFDGNGHKISGINSNGTQTMLFDDIYVSEIKNLEIECKEKEDGRGLGVYLANSTIDSKFTNCSITGNRIEIDGYCSAMIKEAYASEFIHCINNADIIYNNNTQIVAGLVCGAENCIFDKCENNGNIAATKAFVVGGIIAQAKNCIIKDCINRGDITTYGYTAGIVAGVTNTDNRPCTTSITGCTNEGKVESIAKGNHTYTAGICIIYNGSNGSTYADELIINNCVNNGEIEGDTVAGIIGNSSGNLKLSDCENNGAINGRYSAGGIAQCIENKNSNEAEVSNCINNGNVFGGTEAAGIIDYAEGITVTNCINNGNISSNGYVGGIFSYTSSVKGTGLVNNGKISGLEDIGGISAYD